MNYVDIGVDKLHNLFRKRRKISYLWCFSGAAERTRTSDPIITNDVLYQLSYSGAVGPVRTGCVQRYYTMVLPETNGKSRQFALNLPRDEKVRPLPLVVVLHRRPGSDRQRVR